MVRVSRAQHCRLSALALVLMISTRFLATAQPSSAKQTLGATIAKRHGSGETERDEEVDCSASGVDDWDKGLHIGAIFIVMAVGGLGSFLPVVGRFVRVLHIPPTALTLGKFLGTGVIIATALIHMLPDATESLGNPCIGGRMGDYGGWPGVIAMMAIFAMHLMEFLLSNYTMSLHGHSHGLPSELEHHSHSHTHAHGSEERGSNATAPVPSKASDSKISLDSASRTPAADIADAQLENQENCDAVAMHTHHTHVHGVSILGDNAAQASYKQRISTYILELGICLHSVIIGLTLSVTTGTGFKTLLIAICFHQFCEGLALGSRLSDPIHHFKKSHARAFLGAALSAAIFMLITPLGMVIGIGVRYSYKPNSPSSLIAMGVLDALAAGILLYTGLVNLLAEEFGTLEFRGYRMHKKIACFLVCFIGAGVMALIGKWA
ncbi:hypothetical protein IW140_005634 [Coemansia sp. RSA 1813]|nr:hypothetical protein EV178_003890 [Coemansia sp. RSA 1646]KAJ1770436.1 hypothetical protein LPJ74_003171 [Coemansia sp. RSA 1843]KAJ2086518.1 hypothetical protein IW138_005638 [Coemansia sp. RSA 986]KAJ2212565.1 hypothetical protein EV179_004547 [Coemansia sp. RSA 487]KAJ2564719.1 hypothetical protein IW140_005634 [Coemansia sp. RSA 1813]